MSGDPRRARLLGLALLTAGTVAGCVVEGGPVGREPAAPFTAPCVTSAECGGRTPLCGPAGTCVGCVGASDCPREAPLCNSAGSCAQCGGDSECRVLEVCVDGRCLECTRDDQCGGGGLRCMRGECLPECDGDGDCSEEERCLDGLCGQCSADADCAEDGARCLVEERRCVECSDALGCPDGDPFCVEGQCRECVQNTDCPPGESCTTELECRVVCATDAACTGDERPWCEIATGRCEHCVRDEHCDQPGAPRCVEGECLECASALDCPVDQPSCDSGECR